MGGICWIDTFEGSVHPDVLFRSIRYQLTREGVQRKTRFLITRLREVLGPRPPQENAEHERLFEGALVIALIKHAVKRGFAFLGLSVSRLPRKGQARDNSLAGQTLKPWFEEPEFARLFEPAYPYTGLTPPALYLLTRWLDHALRLPGNVAEFGVFRGGSALVLARRLAERAPDKTLHLLDTFEGMPETDPSKDNYYRKGDFAGVSLAHVQGLFHDVPLQIRWHPGLFQDTAPRLADERFCFAHVDCDIHSSAKFVTEFLYPRLSPGGVILYDDYGWRDCAGEKLAVDEFFAARPEVPILLTTSQCVVIRGPHGGPLPIHAP